VNPHKRLNELRLRLCPCNRCLELPGERIGLTAFQVESHFRTSYTCLVAQNCIYVSAAIVNRLQGAFAGFLSFLNIAVEVLDKRRSLDRFRASMVRLWSSPKRKSSAVGGSTKLRFILDCFPVFQSKVDRSGLQVNDCRCQCRIEVGYSCVLKLAFTDWFERLSVSQLGLSFVPLVSGTVSVL